MGERGGKQVHIVLSNNFTYTGKILTEDQFFITILDKYGEEVSIGKRDIQVIKECGK